MSSKRPVVAVIGCGRIAQGAHFPAFAKLGNVRVKYACDLIIEKAQKMKEMYSFVENVIVDYKEALADPEVDTVYVLTPNYGHYEIGMAALKAGKNVFCEKPITVNYEKSVEMANEAKKQGKLLNIGVCNRANEGVRQLAKLVKEGKLGNVYHVYCAYRKFRCIPGLGGPFTTKELSGGGVLIDWGVHFFDLILYILGGAKVKTATCDTYSEMAKDMKKYKFSSMHAIETSDVEHGTNDVEDFVTGYIRTDKASISFNGAWAQNIDIDEMYIDFLGDRGGARLSYTHNFVLWTTDEDGNVQKVEKIFNIPDMYMVEDGEFLDAVMTGEKNDQYVDEILESARLLQLLYDSAKIKKEIDA